MSLQKYVYNYIMKREEKLIVYAFIDSQNLYMSVTRDIRKNHTLIYEGWTLDYHKFRRYLADKFHVKKAFLFIGYIPQNKDLYHMLVSSGYELIFKQTVKDPSGKAKGNVDAEIVLYASAILFQSYDKAVIVSGDGDFRCLLEFLKNRNKLGALIIPNNKSESRLLVPFQKFKVFLSRERKRLEG